MSGIITSSKGTVASLVLLLVASATIRLFSSTEAVRAATPSDSKAASVIESTSSETDTGPKSNSTPLLRAFEAREKRLDNKEKEIEERLRDLSIAEQALESKLERLKTAEAELRETLSLANSAAENDLNQLTTVYENMKPKVAAAVFQEMDTDFAAGFIARMNPESAAAILAGMDPQSAYTISAILAGRNANVPKN